MQKVLNAIRKVRFTLRQASIQEKKGPSLEEAKSRSSSAKSLRSKIRASVPRRDWATTAMCPKQGLRSCQKYLQAQTEGQGYTLLTYKEVVSPKCLIKREFVVDSGASMHMVSEKGLQFG